MEIESKVTECEPRILERAKFLRFYHLEEEMLYRQQRHLTLLFLFGFCGTLTSWKWVIARLCFHGGTNNRIKILTSQVPGLV